MGNKDLSMKAYLRNNERFADVVNGVLFNGEKKVIADTLIDMSSEQITQLGISLPKYQQFQRDILKQGIFKSNGEQIYCLFGIENQTNIDNKMPLRVMEYDVLSYKEQLRNKKEELVTTLEFLTNMSRNSKLIPVITIVFNLSNKNWSGPKSLHEMLNTSNEDILKFIPEYKLNLLSPCEMSDEEIEHFETTVKLLMECSKYQDNKEELLRILGKRKEYGDLDIETVQVINTHLNLELEVDEEKENMDMCKAMKELIEDGRNEGRLEGKNEMLVNAVKGFYENGVATNLIAKSLKISVDEVLEIING